MVESFKIAWENIISVMTRNVYNNVSYISLLLFFLEYIYISKKLLILLTKIGV